MTPRNRALLYAPPILGLVAALCWAVVDRVLKPLGKPTGWFNAR